MNLDRLVAILRPLAYLEAARQKRFGVPMLTLLCCLVAFIPPFPLLFIRTNMEGIGNKCDCMFPVQNQTWVLWQSVTSFIIPVFAILLIWMKIAHTIGLANTEDDHNDQSLHQRITLKLIGITAFFLVSIGPFCIVFIGAGFFALQSPESFHNTLAISMVNSLIQPFLYFAINRRLQEDLIRKMQFCSSRETNNVTKVSKLTT